MWEAAASYTTFSKNCIIWRVFFLKYYIKMQQAEEVVRLQDRRASSPD